MLQTTLMAPPTDTSTGRPTGRSPNVSLADFHAKLDVTLAKATELCDRLEGREPDRGQLVDLPAVPLRRNDRQLRRTKCPGRLILQFFVPKLFPKTAEKPDEIPSKRRAKEIGFFPRVSTGSQNYFGYLNSVIRWSRAECVGDPRSTANQ